ILDLVNNLEIPVVTTLHTILSEPDPEQRHIINELGKKSEKVITMAQNTKQMLQSIYGVELGKIEVIHHGVPQKLIRSRETLKKKLGYENRQIISTFGLIGPGKGIEHGIEAIAKVVGGNTTSDVLYLILGQTHPALKEEGTAYRNKLEGLVNKFDLSRNISFVNKYLSKDEIIQYLQLSDIYMTPYLAKDQAVSGTLAYAVGYGKAIVSTPYLYAKEMLSEGNGLLAEFSSPDSLADCIKQILQDPDKKAMMERKTAKIGRTMYWNKVALHYTNVLLSIITAAPHKIGAV
ncbi:MAG: glycosyl transferase family 1, partial [Clostridia bacterium BRH_c25]